MSLIVRRSAMTADWRDDVGQVKQINVLPDHVLLEIFDFYVNIDLVLLYGGKRGIEAWQSLVHVSRRRRNLVFRSPHCLNLRLYSTVHPERPQKTHWTSGQPFLSPLRVMWPHHQAWTTSLRHLSRAIAYVESTSWNLCELAV